MTKNTGAATGPVRNRLKQILQTSQVKMDMPVLREFRGPRERWISELAKARFALTPRGVGRSSYALFEALQKGCVPIYVWSDLRWLPYSKLWDNSTFGYDVDIRNFESLLSRLVLED